MTMVRKYRKFIRRLAEQWFPGERDTILEKADRQYTEFWKTTPDIGGRDNMQFKDLDFLIAFFAFYEACGRQIGTAELEEFACETVVKPAKAAGKIINWNNPLMEKISTRLYAGYKKKIDRHVARGEWGNTWRIELNPEGHREGFAIHTRMCPNVDFCKAHGYEEFLPVVCSGSGYARNPDTQAHHS